MYYIPEEDGMAQKEKVQKRENEVLDIIKAFYAKHHYSPTVREITKKSSLHSTNTVHRYLNKLKKKGLIDWQEKTSRTIVVIKRKEESSAI